MPLDIRPELKDLQKHYAFFQKLCQHFDNLAQTKENNAKSLNNAKDIINRSMTLYENNQTPLNRQLIIPTISTHYFSQSRFTQVMVNSETIAPTDNAIILKKDLQMSVLTIYRMLYPLPALNIKNSYQDDILLSTIASHIPLHIFNELFSTPAEELVKLIYAINDNVKEFDKYPLYKSILQSLPKTEYVDTAIIPLIGLTQFADTELSQI